MPSNPKAQLEYKNSSDTLVYSGASSTTFNFNTYYSLKFVKQGTTISVYFNNVLLDSRTNVDAINTAESAARTVSKFISKMSPTNDEPAPLIYLKNLKIKQL